MSETAKQLSNIEIQINRLLSQKSALQNHIKKKENSQRKARTRTLIQLGGLLNLTPLLSICDIELGEDLQLNSPDKSATLLGLLIHLCSNLSEQITAEELEKFKEIGVKMMKQSQGNSPSSL